MKDSGTQSTDIRKVVYDEEHATIYLNKSKSLVEVVWHGFANSEAYRTTTSLCLQIALDQRVQFWISDRRNMRAVRPVDQEWTAQVIAPMFQKTDLRKVAIITSTDIFNQMATNAMHVRANEMITFDSRYFEDPASAYRWIEEQADELGGYDRQA